MGSNWLLLGCLGTGSAIRDRQHADLSLKAAAAILASPVDVNANRARMGRIGMHP